MNRPSRPENKQTDRVLTAWDASIDKARLQKLSKLSERRAFIGGMLKSSALLASMPLWSGLSGCDRQAKQQKLVHQEPWRSFAAVQQQLFPVDDNGPSADDLNATLYLKFVMEALDTDPDDRIFVLDGIKWLNDLSNKTVGQQFVALDKTQQDMVLQKIAASTAGERWLSHLLLYIMEALLTDPVYGGNPEGIGWQWLEHQPGFPTPSANKRYVDLL